MSEYPFFKEGDFIEFPDVKSASPEGIVACGGNLSPGMLLSAYRQGIFPWFSCNEPILWWSPDPRFVLYPEKLHIPRSLNKVAKKTRMSLTVDTAFSELVKCCSEASRPEQAGTWITDEMIEGYTVLHELGYAHSIETWLDGKLVGGFYGVSIGAMFFGESMFAKIADASKYAFMCFAQSASGYGIGLIDCQIYTDHLERFGAENIPRSEYLCLLEQALSHNSRKGKWTSFFQEIE